MKQLQFAQGTFLLTAAIFLSKVIGSLFRIPLQNIAGDEVFGIFNLVYPIYMLALILAVAGIPLAISKLIAEYHPLQEKEQIFHLVQTAKQLALGLGFAFFLFLYIFASPIANLLGGEKVKPALLTLSLTLLIAPYMAVYRGYFQGFLNLQPTAISQIIEQIIRVILMLSIAVYFSVKQYPAEQIASNIMFGSFVGALAALIYLQVRFHKGKINNPKTFPLSSKLWLKYAQKILKTSIPLAFGAIATILINLVDSFTIPQYLLKNGVNATETHLLFGLYSRGTTIGQITTVFASAFALMIIPILAKYRKKRDLHALKQNIIDANVLIHLTSWPIGFFLFSFAPALNFMLFTDTNGSLMFGIHGLASIFISLTILTTSILQGLNFANRAAVILLLCIGLKFIFNITLLHFFGITGGAIATLFVYLLFAGLNEYYIFRMIQSAKHYYKVIIISILSFSMIGVIYLISTLFPLLAWSRTFVFFYLSLAILVGIGGYLGLLHAIHIIRVPSIKQFLRKTRSKL